MNNSFREIKQEIKNRSQEIERLNHQLTECLNGDKSPDTIVGQECLDRAGKIQNEIFELIKTNDFYKSLLIKQREIIQKYKFDGRYFDPYGLDLEKAEKITKEKLAFLLNDQDAYIKKEKEEIENQIIGIEKAEEELEEFYNTFWNKYLGIIDDLTVVS